MDNRRHLYHARINRHLTLEQVGARTALSPSVLRHIDEGRYELLPSGLYARSYVRTFAAEVGLDPEATLQELEHLLPGAPDPLPALNEIKGSRFKGFGLGGFEVLLRIAAALKALWQRVERSARAALNRVAPWPRAVLNRVGPWRPPVLNRVERRPQAVLNRVEPWLRAILNRVEPWPAAAIDALLLLAVDAFLVLLISWSSGVAVDHLLQDTGWTLGAFCAVPIALYFVLFGGIAGSTLGRSVCSLIDPMPDHPLTLPDILRRAVLR